MPSIPGGCIEGNILRMSSVNYTKIYGNVFLSCWDVRIKVELGGYEYRGGRLGSGSWMDYLPTLAPARLPRLEIYQYICRDCVSRSSYEFFHRYDSVGYADQRNAFLKYSKRTKKAENDRIFKSFQTIKKS